MIPGVDVTISESAPAAGVAGAGRWFATGFAERGPVDRPVRVTGAGQFRGVFGEGTAPSLLSRAVAAYFAAGGSEAWISRVVGPAAAAASVVLQDSVPGPSLTVSAKDPGAWGNSLKVAVVAGDVGGEFRLVVTENDVEVDRSPSLVDTAAAAAWSASSRWVTVTVSGANDPAVVAATALTSGADDAGNAVDTQWQAALDRFGRDLGPGQVSHPGRTTAAAHAQVIAHARERNRFAVLDGPDTATVGTLTGLAVTGRAVNGSRRAILVAPWGRVPGVAAGAVHTVPYSAIQAGLIARADRLYGPGQNAAGVFAGVADGVADVTQTWTDAQRETLNAAGVTVARVVAGRVVTYGMRSLTDPVEDQGWLGAQNARVVMVVQADAEQIGERFLFRQIDGRGHLLSEFKGELVGMLRGYYDQGSLFGVSPEDAFVVDVGEGVNTPETLGRNELRAVLRVRVSPGAEHVVIEIVKKRLEEVV